MSLLIVKLYQLYKMNGDPNPEMKIAGYVATVLYFATWCVVLPSLSIIEIIAPNANIKVGLAGWVIASLVIFCVYYRLIYRYLFFNKRMSNLEKKFGAFNIPAFLLYLIVILLPVILMMIGPTLAVLLTGGEILGNRISGLLE